MRVLIIGLGSIAKKHIKVINELDPFVNIYALRSSHKSTKIAGVSDVYSFSEIKDKPDFVIISNPTSHHYNTIKGCLALNAPLFIEKPSLMSMDGAWELADELDMNNIRSYVACNLRFHPVIEFLKKELPKHRLIEANVYVGSYLPGWRPGRDYSKIYSAIAELGGGVHLDMIHELDYSYWLFGKPTDVICTTKHISDLNISSIDYAHYEYLYPNKVANITMNYYRRDSKRTIELVFEDKTWIADLENATVSDTEGNIIFRTEFNIMQTYAKQMKYFLANLQITSPYMNSFRKSLEILNICLHG